MTEEVQPAAERPVAPIAFIDTETDGIHPGRKPWEIAVIRREPDGRQTEWAAFVDIDLSTANPFGLRVGKFYDRHPLGRALSAPMGDATLAGPTTSAYNAAFTTARFTHDAVVVGINPTFDVEVLDRLLRDHGLLPSWDYTPICAKTLAVGWLIGRGLLDPKTDPPPWKTADIVERLGIDPGADEDRHTTLGDAKLAMRMFDAVGADDLAADVDGRAPITDAAGRATERGSWA